MNQLQHHYIADVHFLMFMLQQQLVALSLFSSVVAVKVTGSIHFTVTLKINEMPYVFENVYVMSKI